MLPARYRMRRSTDFTATVKCGRRVVQPDLVIHARQVMGQQETGGPRVGLIITKSVGSAVERHRIARRLRHVVRAVVTDLGGAEQVVIRALPSSRNVRSARLEQQLRAGIDRIHRAPGESR